MREKTGGARINTDEPGSQTNKTEIENKQVLRPLPIQRYLKPISSITILYRSHSRSVGGTDPGSSGSFISGQQCGHAEG